MESRSGAELAEVAEDVAVTTAGGAELSIAAACEQTGLSRRTVRYYEELGLVPGVRRSHGGRRVYGKVEVERLRFIQRLKALGLSLAEIKQLNAVYAIAGSTGAMLERLDVLLGERLEELEGRIDELIVLRDEMSRYRDHIGSRIGALSSGTARPGPGVDGELR